MDECFIVLPERLAEATQEMYEGIVRYGDYEAETAAAGSVPNPQLLALPPAVRLTEIGLRMYADTSREQVHERLLIAAIYPVRSRE